MKNAVGVVIGIALNLRYMSLYICQNHRPCNTKSEPLCKLCALCDNDVNVDSSTVTNGLFLVGDVDGSGGCVCGQRACGNALYFLLSFACEPETVLKNKVC